MKRLLFLLFTLTTILFTQEPKKELSDFVFRQRVAIVPSTITTNHFQGARFRAMGLSYFDSVTVNNYVLFSGSSAIPLYLNAWRTSYIDLEIASAPSTKMVTLDNGTLTKSTSIEVRNSTNTTTLSRVKVVADGSAVTGSSTYDYFVSKADDHKWYINGVQKLGLPSTGILATNGIANTGNITSTGNVTADLNVITSNINTTTANVDDASVLKSFKLNTTTVNNDFYNGQAPVFITSADLTSISLPDISAANVNNVYYLIRTTGNTETITLAVEATDYFEGAAIGVDYTWTYDNFRTLQLQAVSIGGNYTWIILSIH